MTCGARRAWACIAMLASAAVGLAAPRRSLAAPGRCEVLARPSVFDADSAMEAVFCEYRRDKHGTLLPLARTKAWDASGAEQLLRAHLVSTFVEHGVEKGVLVVKRQQLTAGEPALAHAVGVGLSVYVFRFDGARWVFEKGNRDLATSGGYGQAPRVSLIRIGPDAAGFWFEGTDMGQGYTSDYGFLVPLDRPTVTVAWTGQLGASNLGACSEDPAESGAPLRRCWSFTTRLEFLEAPGGGVWDLRLRRRGTRIEGLDQPVESADGDTCLRRTGAAYQEFALEDCSSRAAFPDERVRAPSVPPHVGARATQTQIDASGRTGPHR